MWLMRSTVRLALCLQFPQAVGVSALTAASTQGEVVYFNGTNFGTT